MYKIILVIAGVILVLSGVYLLANRYNLWTNTQIPNVLTRNDALSRHGSRSSSTANSSSNTNNSNLPTGSINTSEFNLYARVTAATWPNIHPFARSGDLFWGEVSGIPSNMRAYTFPDYASLSTKATDTVLAQYSAVNLDGEYKDFNQALSDAQNIRSFVDEYNLRYKNTPGSSPLKFVAFYHLNIINAEPSIVNYPDVILVGKSEWDSANIQSASGNYIETITKAGKTPGILLGDSAGNPSTRTKSLRSNSDVLASFQRIIDPPPQGLGLKIVGFYYNGDDDSALLAALQTLRPN